MLNKIEINGKLYPIIYSFETQLGDDSCFDRGIQNYIVSDGNNIVGVSSEYNAYLDEEYGYTRDYKEWKTEIICSIEELLNI